MLTNDEIQSSQRREQIDTARGGNSIDGFGPASRKSSLWKKLGVVVVAALLVFGIVRAITNRSSASGPSSAAPRSGPPAVPVVAGQVIQKDVPIYLDGLGTVQAFNTVTIHPQVDGRLQKVVFTEGQDVRAGDLLAQIDPAPFQAQVEQAEAKKAQDEAQLANARLDLKRDADQLAANIVAQQVYDSQKTLVDQFEASVKASQAAIDLARVQLDYTTIVSPIDGRTGIRLVDQGNVVHANDANGLVVIAQLHPISVVFTLPQQDLGDIQEHRASGELAVLAVGRDNSTVLDQGHLAVIDNQIDTTTGTIRLKATFPNDNLRLWPGQFVNARLLLTTRKGGLVVPASVIQRGPEGSYAFVIKADQSVEVRPVTVAQIEAGQALIDEGLRGGEQVVVDGQYRLQTGSRVKLASSAKSGDSEP